MPGERAVPAVQGARPAGHGVVMLLTRQTMHVLDVNLALTIVSHAASEMTGLRRMVEGMRHEMQCLEDELFQLREERAQLDMERAAAADEADAASAVLAAAEKRQADLVAAVDEVSLNSEHQSWVSLSQQHACLAVSGLQWGA